MPVEDDSPLQHLDAIRREDLAHVTRAMTLEDLEKMKLAEEVFDLHFKRRTRSGTLMIVTQSILSVVAVAGILQNAYQSWLNNQQLERQQKVDQERWSRQFERTQAADKYRAFFDTSALATDPGNPDKRLVGYALLQEFVRDSDYNAKAALLLEQSLGQELGRDKEPGLSEEARSMVVTILRSLSDTKDCKVLEQAARSIDEIAKRLERTHDTDEAAEVFGLYVRALVGRAPLVCSSFDDVRQVWRPLREALQKNPALGGLSATPTAAEAGSRIVEILRDHCLREVEIAGSSDCPEIFERYGQHCAVNAGEQANPQACRILSRAAEQLAAVQARVKGDGARAAAPR